MGVGWGVKLQLQAMGRGQICVTQVRSCGRGCRREWLGLEGILGLGTDGSMQVSGWAKELLARGLRKLFTHAFMHMGVACL